MEQQNQEDQESNPQQPLTPPSLGQNQVDPALIDPQLFAEPTPAGPILTLQRSVLRPYYEGDIDDVVAEANNHRVARWQPESFHHPFTREDAESFVREYTPSEGDPIEQLAICRLDTNVLIGGIGVVPCTWEHRRTFEIGYWLGESHW
jgi:RimJ/RimL family protein N-acetyltransferase